VTKLNNINGFSFIHFRACFPLGRVADATALGGLEYLMVYTSGESSGCVWCNCPSQTSVTPPWMTPLCQECAPLWCPWK